MTASAGLMGLALLAVLAAGVPLLAAARWPLRSPACVLVLWQAVGLAVGLLTVLGLATLALSPLGDTHQRALRRLGDPLPWWAWLAGALAVVVLARLAAVLAGSVLSTVRERRRLREAVDLVATRNPLLRGARVLDHEVPVAYCLPGLWRPRVVLSRGVLTGLHDDELQAVLEHERAHLEQRHDLVVLPFVALGATFPWLAPVRRAQASVALLVEALADDRAARRHDRAVLARALCKVGGGQVPGAGLAAAGDGPGVLVRAERLLVDPDPLPLGAQAAVLLAAVLVGALPLLGLLLPLVG